MDECPLLRSSGIGFRHQNLLRQPIVSDIIFKSLSGDMGFEKDQSPSRKEIRVEV